MGRTHYNGQKKEMFELPVLAYVLSQETSLLLQRILYVLKRSKSVASHPKSKLGNYDLSSWSKAS